MRFLKSITSAMMGMLFTSASFAVDYSSLIPTGSDKSVSMFLQKLFGSLVGLAGGPAGGLDPLIAVLGFFNGFVLIVGSLLLGYTIVAGTMQTAHDGEMLGKKWSSMWVPLRTSLGVFSILPIFNGYAAVQVMVMWLVLQGVGAANIGWSLFSSGFSASQQGVVMQAENSALDTTVDSVLKTLVCSETVAAKLNQKDGSGNVIGAMNLQGYTAANATPIGKTIRWTDRSVYGETGCGGYNLAATFSTTSPSGADTTQVRLAHDSGMTALVLALTPTAQKIAQKSVSDGTVATTDSIAASFDRTAIKQTYLDAVQLKVQALLDDESQLRTMQRNMEADGWLMAGAWYVQWARYSTEIRSAMTNYPTVVPPQLSVFGDLQGPIETALKGPYATVVAKADQRGMGISSQNDALIAEEGGLSWFWTKTGRALFGAGLNTFVGTSADVNKNPLLVAEALGSHLIGTSSALIVTGGAASIGGAVVQKIPGLGAIAGKIGEGLGGVLLAIGLPMMVLGLTLGYYIPFLPFILWMGGVIGWLVMVVEAVIAAPLWALAHLYPDGDGIVGRGGQGYSLVLSLTMRPLLMILGLTFSMAIMWPLGYFLHTVFVPAFKLSQGGSIGFFGMFAGIGLYTYLLVNLVTKVLNLMHMVPDQILKWMGGPSANLGEFGHSMNQGLQAATGAFAGAAMGQLSGFGNARRQMAQTKQLKENNELERDQAITARLGKTNSMESAMGVGMGVADAAGEAAQLNAVKGARSSLDKSSHPQNGAWGKAVANKDGLAQDKMVRNEIKAQHGGDDKDVRMSAASEAYEGVRSSLQNTAQNHKDPEKRGEALMKLASMAPNYQDAMAKYQGQKSGNSSTPGDESTSV